MSFRAVILIAALLVSSTLYAAEIGLEPIEPGSDGPSRYYLRGEIEKGDSDKLRKLIADTLHDGAVGVLAVSSPGGDVSEARKLAELMRKYHFQVSVEGDGCYSSCFFLFAAAPVRGQEMAPKGDRLAPIGVHRIYLTERAAKAITMEEFRSVSESLWRETAAYLEELQVPSQIIEAVRNTASSEIHILTQSEIDSMGFFSPWHREFVKARCGVDFRLGMDEEIQKKAFDCSISAVVDAQLLVLARDRALGDP